MLRTISIAALLATGCTIHTYPATRTTTVVHDVQASKYSDPVYVSVSQPPPPLRAAATVSSRPSAGAVWVEGHWSWSNGWVWVDGRWMAPRDGYEWEAPVCVAVDSGGYQYHPGYWRRRDAQPPTIYRTPGTIQVHARRPGATVVVNRVPPSQANTATVVVRASRPTAASSTVTVQARPANNTATVQVRPTRPNNTATVQVRPTQPNNTTVQVRPTRPNNTTTVQVRPTNPQPNTTVTVRPSNDRPNTTVTVRPSNDRPNTTVRPTTTATRPTTTVRPNTTVRPTTTATRPTTTVRPNTTVRPTTTATRPTTTVRPNTTVRPTTTATRPTTTVRPNTTVRPTTTATRPTTNVQPNTTVRPTTMTRPTVQTNRPATTTARPNPNARPVCRPAVTVTTPGGYLVLRGANLQGATGVTFGGRAAGIVSNSGSEIRARVEQGSRGGAVRVVVNGRPIACGNVQISGVSR